jgi:hypothetical protein
MDRRYEWAIGGVLTVTALTVGIAAGCSASPAGNTPSAATDGATSSRSTVGAVQSPNSPAAVTARTGSSPSRGSVGNTLPSRCRMADLGPEVSVVPGSAGAGHELLNVKLTNNSGHSCTVYGFPGLKLEDKAGRGQTTHVTWDRRNAPKLITLADHASAAATVRFDFDVPAADESQSGDCELPSAYLQITPPDETTQLVAPITGGPVTVCQHGALDVLPFIAGATGANQ